MRAIERINELLNGFFNPDGKVYKELVGDPSRQYQTEITTTGSLVNYQDSDFTDLNDDDTKKTFLPIQTENSSVSIKIGDYEWECAEQPGSNKLFSGKGIGSSGGAFQMIPSGNWNVFSRELNGVKNITFPPLGIGAMSIGSTFEIKTPAPFTDVGYSTGSEGDLNNPDDGTDTPSNFLPFIVDYSEPEAMMCHLFAGDAFWASLDPFIAPGMGNNYNGASSTIFYGSDNAQSMNGAIYFQGRNEDLVSWTPPPPLSNAVSADRFSYSPSTNNGLKTFSFGSSQGSFQYYYHRDAWKFAMDKFGTGLKFVISQRGSVYANTVSSENLIVDYNGNVGLYSGGTADGRDPIAFNQNIISFFYSKSAFIFAFLNNSEKLIVTIDGSVYKSSVSNENLVVNGLGEIGIAGGGNIRAKINFENTGIMSNILGYLKRIEVFFSEQVSLKTAVGNYLSYIGSEFFGIERVIGEIDLFYRQRIPAQTFSLKETPINIENLVLPFCTDCYVDDDLSSGFFADATFSDFEMEYHVMVPSPEWVFSCRTGGNYGLIFYFAIYILQPLADYESAISNIIKKAKVAGVIYDVFTFEDETDYNNAIGA